jgi:hypothetical protein
MLSPLPVRVSPAQKRKLMTGGAVTLKPSQFSEDANYILKVMPNTVRRVATAMKKDKGVRVMLKAGEDMLDTKTGGSILGDMKKGFKQLGRELKPVGKQIASTLIREGIPAVASALGSAAGSAAATAALQPELAPLAGFAGARAGRYGGQKLARLVSRKTGYGTRLLDQKVSAREGIEFFKKDLPRALTGKGTRLLDQKFSAREGIDFFKKDLPRAIKGKGMCGGMMGCGFKPAGGDNYGSGIPIQLGSPYIMPNSPANHPFIAKSIQLTGRGFMPAGN